MTVSRSHDRTQTTVAFRVGGRSGVTFLEMLLVIVIMVIIASASIPALTTIGRGVGVRGAVNSITASLKLSRQWAISHRQDAAFYYVNLNSNDSAQNYFGVYDWRRRDIQGSNQLPQGVIFSGMADYPCTNYVWFESDGSLTNSSNHNIYLIDPRREDALHKKISIYGLTGRVKVTDD